jgi:hypothetical protein
MQIFLIGMPQSGRTTVAKYIASHHNYGYIDATSWILSSFREPLESETISQYQDAKHTWLLERIKENPKLIVSNIQDIISINKKNYQTHQFVIDGLFSPKDFTELFDYHQDMVIFVNRLNNPADYQDYENIGASVIRDYCFWLSSADCLPKERWIEFNFSIPGENNNYMRQIGSKNSIFLVKNLNKVNEILTGLLSQQPYS